MTKRIAELEKKVKKLEVLLTKYRQENKQLKLKADYDFLTGLYNRHGFFMETEKFYSALVEFHRKGCPNKRRDFRVIDFSLIFIDLDGLKQLNDEYGHKVGDIFIKECAKVFKGNIRDMDIVGRIGGDEFIIGLINANEKEAVRIAEKLRKKIHKIKIEGVDKKHKFSASFGVMEADGSMTKPIPPLYEVIENADRAMYEAKLNKGKNFIVAFSKIKKRK